MGVICSEKTSKNSNRKSGDNKFKEIQKKKSRDGDDVEIFFFDTSSEKYDMILNFYSFEQLKKNGYKYYFTTKGKEKYNNCKNELNIVIGILGMKNRGKSFLLGQIMQNTDYLPPNGFLDTTYGISCNFPRDRKSGAFFITLDTAGRDSPLLQNNIFDDNNYKNFIKDQAITEIVLSDYIIQESTVLIAVVEQLSFEEQEMLKTLITRLKRKEIKGNDKRKLLVIHNLMNIRKVENIKKFIEGILKKSLTFKLKEQSMWKNFDKNDSKRKVYIQVFDDNEEDPKQSKLEIIHLVFGAHDNEERNEDIKKVKKEYNEPALRFIRDYISVDKGKEFDIVESFHKFLIKNSHKYLTKFLDENSIVIGKEQKLKKTMNETINDKIHIEKTYIPLEGKNLSFNLKELSKESFNDKIVPRYSARLIKKENNGFFIEIIFELFGKVKKLKRKIMYDDDKNIYIIMIRGELEEIEKGGEIIYGNMEYSLFEFPIKIAKFLIDKIDEKEIEIEIEILELEKEKEKDIKIDENNNGVYSIYLASNIYNDLF